MGWMFPSRSSDEKTQSNNTEQKQDSNDSNEQDSNEQQQDSNDPGEEDYVDTVTHWVDAKEEEHKKLQDEFAKANAKLDKIDHQLEDETTAEIERRKAFQIEMADKRNKFNMLKKRIKGMESDLEKILKNKEESAFKSVEKHAVDSLQTIAEDHETKGPETEGTEAEGAKTETTDTETSIPAEYRVHLF